MDQALSAIRNGDMGLNAVARTYGINKSTIKRHLNKTNAYANDDVRYFGHPSVFSAEMEDLLEKHILKLDSLLFGISPIELRRMAYDLAVRNGVPHKFNNMEKLAGKKWYYSFLKRHPCLSLRAPEPTSLARAQGFNRESVSRFFGLLENMISELGLDATNVYNMDESGLTSVQRPGRVISLKGKKQVGGMTSGERGQTTSVVCCVSASGRYIPPMVIFKRKRMPDVLKEGAPPGSLITSNDSGWMEHASFLAWMEHFDAHVQSSKKNPVLIILDGHSSHTKNIAAIEYARERGIHMLSLPPHTTHKLQPLDRSFFGPLMSNFNQAADKWMRNHAGKGITTYQICSLFGEAYVKTASMSNALAGFVKSGIWPCNRDVFTDADYVAADQFCDSDDEPNATGAAGAVEITAGPAVGATAGPAAGTTAGSAVGATAGPAAGTNAGSAAGTTAGPAAGTTAGFIAGTTARPAAGTTARPAAGTTAGSADGTTVGPIAGTTAGSAAGTTAGSAAGTTAGSAAGTTARPAAGTTARPAAGITAGSADGTTAGSADGTTAGPSGAAGAVGITVGPAAGTAAGRIVITRADGRCFFRSLAVCMNDKLQRCDRDDFGQIKDPILKITETNEADSLRASLINCMCLNVGRLSNISVEVLSADLPHGLAVQSLPDRIERMAHQTEMVGELEIIWTAKAIDRQIHVVTDGGTLRYGDEGGDQAPLTIRYTKLGDDVGHYDGLVRSNSALVTPSMISPLPKVTRKKHTRRMGQCELLTSTPYKTSLVSKKRYATSKGSKRPSSKRQLKMKSPVRPTASTEDSWFCFMCSETVEESMVRCCGCKRWVHVACAGDPGARYRCDNCV